MKGEVEVIAYSIGDLSNYIKTMKIKNLLIKLNGGKYENSICGFW